MNRYAKFKIDCKCREAAWVRSQLGQKYVETILREAPKKESGIDDVYGVYLHKD